MELLIIRHGEPAWSKDGLAVDDPPLTDRGQQQAKLLGSLFEQVPVDEVLVSPLVRAQQTAAPVAEATGRDPVTLDWLAEIFPGAWEGTPQEVVQQTFDENRNRPLEEQWEGIPGGESFREFHQRVTGGLHDLLRDSGVVRTSDHPPLWDVRAPDRRIVVVAHGGTNAVLLGHLLGIEPVPWEWERFVSFHASVSTVQPISISNGHSFSLFRFSDTSHLPEDVRTR